MGLEWRGNNMYYYEKERDGDKVRSVYSGKGETAYLLHQLNLWKKREEDFKKQGKSKETFLEKQQENEIDEAFELICEMSKTLTDAFFLANGFHQHKRQWRKKRNGKTE